MNIKQNEVIDIKYGKLPNPQPKIAEEKEFRSDIPDDIRNSIEKEWELKILFAHHPNFNRKVYIVKMINKYSHQFIFIPTQDLHNKKKVTGIVEELNGIGSFKLTQVDDLSEYVDFLKGDPNSPVLSSDEDYEFDIEGVSKESIEEVAAKYYQLIKECIAFHPEFFPDDSDYNFDNESHIGARLTTKKYGDYTHAIFPGFLQDFWDVNTRQQKAIKTVWVKQGLMYHGWGNKSRRDVHVTLNNKSIKMYVMKFDLNGEQTGHE